MINNNNNNNKSGKIPKIVAYGAFDETVCTAPLGPIVAYGAFDETVCTALLGPIVATLVCASSHGHRTHSARTN